MFIQNLSFHDVQEGNHTEDVGAFLIQIVDGGLAFPTPKHGFKETFQFVFSDVDNPLDIVWPARMTKVQAQAIAQILKIALNEERNVFVHCVAGVCRSGAVVEVGTMIGFEDTGAYRSPNVHVKRLLMDALGLVPDYEKVFKDRSYGC